LDTKEKEKMKRTSDILLKGGKLLGESCPKCGGLLLQYQGRTVCVNCDNINEIGKNMVVSTMDMTLRIQSLVSKKIEEVAQNLEKEEDIEKQTHLAELLLKYIEILRKVSRAKKNELKKDNKSND
jgi:uncharacterized Zn finger protein (UPF0148 family)